MGSRRSEAPLRPGERESDGKAKRSKDNTLIRGVGYKKACGVLLGIPFLLPNLSASPLALSNGTHVPGEWTGLGFSLWKP